MDRYTVETVDNYDMERTPDGMWVRHDDAQAAIAAAVAAERERCADMERRLRLAMRQWDTWKAIALDLQARMVKYEGGSPMVLNAEQPNA